MFHKALWLRNYKQGKVAIWLLWISSLYLLPIEYMNAANRIVQMMEDAELWGETVGYAYWFAYDLPLAVFGGLLIILACTLIGGERTNQGMEIIFTMPFKRKDIFLSKWFIGAVNITAVTLVNMALMYVVQKVTIHGYYQTFAPFLEFFLLMFLFLLAIYSLALFMGTITGGFVSQAILTIIVCLLPMGLFELITNAIGWHVDIIALMDVQFWKISDIFHYISLYSVLTPWFQYNQWNGNRIVADAIFQQNGPALIQYIASLVYFVLSFLIGLKLFTRTPSENNGKIILYKKLEPVFLWSVVFCFALLGGNFGGGIFWETPLIGYYIGLIVAGIICYIVLSKLMKKSLKKV